MSATDFFNEAYERGVAAERERCAKIADSYDNEASQCSDGSAVARDIAAAIRTPISQQ